MIDTINKIKKMLRGKVVRKKIEIKNPSDFYLALLDVFKLSPSLEEFETCLSGIGRYSQKRKKLVNFFFKSLIRRRVVFQKDIVAKGFLARDVTLKVINKQLLPSIKKFKLVRTKNIEVLVKNETLRIWAREKTRNLPLDAIIKLRFPNPSHPLIREEKVETENGREVCYMIDDLFRDWYYAFKHENKLREQSKNQKPENV
jgi:hypothetical protein